MGTGAIVGIVVAVIVIMAIAIVSIVAIIVLKGKQNSRSEHYYVLS